MVQKNSMKTKCSFYIKLIQLSVFSLWMIKFLSVHNNNLSYSGVSSPESGSKAASAASLDDVSVSPSVSLLSLTWLTGVSRQPNGLQGSFFLSFWGKKNKDTVSRIWFLPITSLWMCVWKVSFWKQVWVLKEISQYYHFICQFTRTVTGVPVESLVCFSR